MTESEEELSCSEYDPSSCSESSDVSVTSADSDDSMIQSGTKFRKGKRMKKMSSKTEKTKRKKHSDICRKVGVKEVDSQEVNDNLPVSSDSGRADSDGADSDGADSDGADSDGADSDGADSEDKHAAPKPSNLEDSDDDSDEEEQRKGGILLDKATKCAPIRIWDKVQVCFECKKKYKKISEHLESQHSDTDPVKEYLALKVGSKERKNKIALLRNRGNYLHNLRVLHRGHGNLIVVRRPSHSTKFSADDFLPCRYCLGFFLKACLYRHIPNCVNKPAGKETKRNKVLAASKLLVPIKTNTTERFRKKVLNKMVANKIGLVVQNDQLLVSFGAALFSKTGFIHHRKNDISSVLRMLAGLLVEVRKLSTDIKSMSDVILPAHFLKVVDAARSMCIEKGEAPSTAIKMGINLGKLCTVQVTTAVIQGNEKLRKLTEDFQLLLQNEWNNRVNFEARDILKRKRFNKKCDLPSAEDILHLNTFIQKKEEEWIESNFENVSYRELCYVTFVHITTFNRRRPGEVLRTELTTYLNRVKSDIRGELLNALSEEEKHLHRTLQRLEIFGKGRRKVDLILLPNMAKCLDKIVEMRPDAQVPDDNIYLFGLMKCDTHIDGGEAMRKISVACGAKEPKKLRCTAFRKHVATISQVLNLRENELDIVADHMGHDIRIHREFYRLSSETLQLTKVSKLLLLMQRGNVEKATNANLDTLTFGNQPPEETPDEPAACLNDPDFSTAPSTSASADSMAPQSSHNYQSRGQSSSCVEIGSSAFGNRSNGNKRVKQNRVPWTEKEVEIMESEFADALSSGKLPGRAACDACIAKYKWDRPWRKLKDWVRNEIVALNGRPWVKRAHRRRNKD